MTALPLPTETECQTRPVAPRGRGLRLATGRSVRVYVDGKEVST